MRLHRFFIKEKIEKGKETKIDNLELLHQWLKVFRLSSSDRVIVFNGNGFEYEGYFRVLNKKEAVLFLDKENKIDNKPKVELHIFQSIIKKDNFELIAQKCTEIGVSAFHPIISERSGKKDLNIERLNKIVTEASEQSGRGSVPKVFIPVKLEDSIKDFSDDLFMLDFDGKPLSSSLRAKRGNPGLNNKIGLLLGPEGGWSDKDRDFFKKNEIKSVSLGKQVLRAETASIVASALILIG
ncbi:MAG: RsmE family RNA methyltransferase [Candidatus Pacebacteria bacterium]|nr:RsmE family RNA methyltransferase [Candidatus Paceibacterota bacterium]